jgi:hypothetical protein
MLLSLSGNLSIPQTSTLAIPDRPQYQTETMASTRLSYDEGDKCRLPFLDPDGNIVYFDAQAAEPGTFAVPGVIELETYEPGEFFEISWIYFKGDPQAGPQPGHPFERPFNDSAKFSIDLVSDDDTSKVLLEVMRESSLPLPPACRCVRVLTDFRSSNQFFSLLGRQRTVRQTGQVRDVHPGTRQLMQVPIPRRDGLRLEDSERH